MITILFAFISLLLLGFVVIQHHKIRKLESSISRTTEFVNNFMIPRIDENTDKLLLNEAAITVLVNEVAKIHKTHKL